MAIGSAIGGGDEKLSNAGSSSPSSRTEFVPTLTAAAPVPAPIPGLGQEERDGKFAFVITAINSSKTAGDPDNPYMQKTAQGVYFNLHMTVTNIGIEPQTFFATSQKVLAGNREFGADSMASVGTGAATEDINPGNSIDVVVSFDVPAGTVVDTAELHDSAFSGGVKLSLVDRPGQSPSLAAVTEHLG